MTDPDQRPTGPVSTPTAIDDFQPSKRNQLACTALPYAEEQPTVPVWPTAGQAPGLSRSATYAAADRGDIPAIRIGARLLVPTAGLRRLLGLPQSRGGTA